MGLMTEMEERGFMVDLVTITSVLLALHKSGKWSSADRLMKHVRDTTLLPNVLRWKTNLRALLQRPQDKGKDYMSMFRTAGNLGDIMNWVNPSLENDTAEDKPVDDWSLTPYLDRIADQCDSFDNSPMFRVARGKRVLEKGVESFDIDMMNTYLSIFLARGKLSIACKFFEIFTSMGKEPMSYTYNSLMTSFIKKGYVTEAWGILQEMGDNLCPADIATYNAIIQGLGKMRKADMASAVLDQLLRKGGYVDIVMYNTLINALGKAGRINEVNQMFNQMTGSGINPDVVTYNTLIEVHAKSGNVKDAYKYLRKMLATGCSPNHVTDTILDFLGREIERQKYQKASIKRDDV